MSKNSRDYRLLQNSEDNSEDNEEYHPPPAKSLFPLNFSFKASHFLVVLSLLTNVGLLLNQYVFTANIFEPRSKYAKLAYDISRPFSDETPYQSGNLTQIQELWDEINFDEGQISIPHEEAAAMGLPPAQPFPWDPTRGLYLINAYHNIHCLKVIAKTLTQYHSSSPLTWSIEHNFHCLDSLRQETMCHADDTPRYSTNAPGHSTGSGQMRLCRDWNKLEAWAMQLESCWRFLDRSADERPQLERYLYCAKDSPYYTRMREWAGRHPEIHAPVFEE